MGWHAIGAPMRDKYARFIELQNIGARELGYHDTGELWRANYDMTPAAVFRGARARLDAA